MEDGGFRTAEAVANSEKIKAKAPEPTNPDVPSGSIDEVDTPISLMLEMKGHPYTAEFFDVIDIYRDPDIGMQGEILDIDSAYKKKVQTGEYEDSKDSFKAFINEAEKATSTEHASLEVRIAKIAAWVRFMGDLKGIDGRSNND